MVPDETAGEVLADLGEKTRDSLAEELPAEQVIAAAVVVNLLAAALSGVAIPLILQRMGIDPALSGAVVLTTITDVVGFMSFLGLATLFLL